MSLIVLILVNFSCKKDWLDAKTQKSLAVPTTLEDFRALLSSSTTTQPAFNDFYGMLGELGADHFYVANNTFTNGDQFYKNLYTWKPDIYFNTGITTAPGWELAYKQIYYTNIVLKGIEEITPSQGQQVDWNEIKGTALFFRAVAHYSVAREFCKPYIKGSAATDLGIPLRLQPDFNETSVRPSVQETYNLIISDLKESAIHLPVEKPISKTYKCLPTKAAAYGMLARVYLAMSDYENAFTYSDKCLQLYSVLLDYNDASWVNLGFTGTSFKPFNPEIIFHKRGLNINFFTIPSTIVDSALLKLYDADDLRRNAYFLNIGYYSFKGGYGGETRPFAGLATDEIYLIRAECNARLGKTTEALNDVNALLAKRSKTAGPLLTVTASNATDALTKILVERRKELCFRGLRWEDLRRLNLEPQFAVTLHRSVNGTSYELPPNSPLYVLPIPEVVIRLSGMPQNPR